MARLELVGLSKRYGELHAVREVDLRVEQGELVVLLGPSGCGKTTTLRLIAGFVEATAGRVLLGGRDVTGLPPYRRNTGMVFQGYALFPHLSAAEPLRRRLRRPDQLLRRHGGGARAVPLGRWARHPVPRGSRARPPPPGPPPREDRHRARAPDGADEPSPRNRRVRVLSRRG